MTKPDTAESGDKFTEEDMIRHYLLQNTTISVSDAERHAKKLAELVPTPKIEVTEEDVENALSTWARSGGSSRAAMRKALQSFADRKNGEQT